MKPKTKSREHGELARQRADNMSLTAISLVAKTKLAEAVGVIERMRGERKWLADMLRKLLREVEYNAATVHALLRSCTGNPRVDGVLEPRAPRVHELKCSPGPFQAMWDGSKRFEVRWNDGRDFREGDGLRLREWACLDYTGREIRAEVGYMLQGEFGLPHDLCVMQLVRVRPVDRKETP